MLVPTGGRNFLGMVSEVPWDGTIYEYAPEYYASRAGGIQLPVVREVGPRPGQPAIGAPGDTPVPKPLVTPAPVTTPAPAPAAASGLFDNLKAWATDHKLLALLIALAGLYVGSRVLGGK